MSVVLQWLLLIGSIELFKILRCAVTLLVGDGNMTVEFFKAAEGVGFKGRLMFRGSYVTKGNKNRIARVIVSLVESFKLIVCEVRNICWLAATVVVVGAGGIEVLAHGLPEGRVNRTHGALHFVEYDTFIGQLRAGVSGIGKLQTVAFLGKIQGI